MNILINLATLKKGGGQNVGLNFLSGLLQIDNQIHNFFFLVVKNSEIHNFLLKTHSLNIITTSSSSMKRIFYEIFKYSKLFRELNIDIIYTYFGYGLFSKKIPQVSGIAVSNVFFPEIKFWEGSFFEIFIRKIIDGYRIYGIKNATALIFENKTMEEKSHFLFKIQPERTCFIPPSFNPHFEQEALKLVTLEQDTIKLLMLCGWQRNKNIMKVPEIAFYLKKSNHLFQFIITAPQNNSKEHMEFLALTKQYEVVDNISLIGPVKKQHLKSLYTQINFVLLMSKLESFSNNIIEAWCFQKPLIISDEEWAKGICKNAALFIKRDSPKLISNSIIRLVESQKIQLNLINNGLIEIKSYPTIVEKTKKEIKFLERIYNEF